MVAKHQFTNITFRKFKAFNSFSLNLRHFNILVGPNNAGKSTVLAAFRILAAALRRATTRRPELIKGPNGRTFGYTIDLSAVSVAEENIFYNYDDSEPASVRFRLSNQNELLLYFPERDSCYLIADSPRGQPRTPSTFRSNFDCPIGFVPILGPVEHIEPLYEREAARLALFNYRAARNFRNIWLHFPERFEEFRTALRQTWPGMDIQPPDVDTSHQKPRLHMFCPEERIPREIFWAGFGFQVWCQMLTHVIQSSEVSFFLIDEPDIYLHSDLQRQLLVLLRNLGPDILIATHSTEIISEAEADDIVLINKKWRSGRRIQNPSQLGGVFAMLGSNINPILTQLAKTRKALFLEGKDFQIIGRFARKLANAKVGNRTEFAVVPVEGFNPERVRSIKAGMEMTLGNAINAALVMDRDYRSQNQCNYIELESRDFCQFVKIHDRKEIENFLLIPSAIDRAASQKVRDHAKRTGKTIEFEKCAAELLRQFSDEKKSYVTAQYLSERRRFERTNAPKLHDADVSEMALTEFEEAWKDEEARLRMVPGKEALSFLNSALQEKYGISVTATAIIDSMKLEEVPTEMHDLIQSLSVFAEL